MKRAPEFKGVGTKTVKQACAATARTLLAVILVGGIAPVSLYGAFLTTGDYIVSATTGLFRVDPLTGDRSLISGTATDPVSGEVFTRGSGLVLQGPGGVVAAEDGTLFVNDERRHAVVMVNPATGDRTVISGDPDGVNRGGGVDLVGPWGLTLGVDGNLLIADRGINGVFSVDPETGNRTVVTDYSEGIGDGPAFIDPRDILQVSDGTIFVGNSHHTFGGLFSVDPDSGDRTIIIGWSSIDGGVGIDVFRIGWGPDQSILMPTDDSVTEVDVETGGRSVLSGDGVGSGPEMSELGDLVYDDDGRLIVLHYSEIGRVFAVDVATGDREIVTGLGTGSGPDFSGRFIAIYPAVSVPEPRSLWMAFVGVALVLVFLPRRLAVA